MIDDSINQAFILVSVITPAYLKSEYCQKELMAPYGALTGKNFHWNTQSFAPVEQSFYPQTASRDEREKTYPRRA